MSGSSMHDFLFTAKAPRRQDAKAAKKGTTDTKQSPLDAGFAGVGGVTGRAGSPALPVPKPSGSGFASWRLGG